MIRLNNKIELSSFLSGFVLSKSAIYVYTCNNTWRLYSVQLHNTFIINQHPQMTYLQSKSRMLCSIQSSNAETTHSHALTSSHSKHFHMQTSRYSRPGSTAEEHSGDSVQIRVVQQLLYAGPQLGVTLEAPLKDRKLHPWPIWTSSLSDPQISN